jgi:hypothetical protein
VTAPRNAPSIWPSRRTLVYLLALVAWSVLVGFVGAASTPAGEWLTRSGFLWLVFKLAAARDRVDDLVRDGCGR